MREHGTYVCYRFGPDGGSDSTLGCHCTACSLAARAPWPGPVPWLPPVAVMDWLSDLDDRVRRAVGP